MAIRPDPLRGMHQDTADAVRRTRRDASSLRGLALLTGGIFPDVLIKATANQTALVSGTEYTVAFDTVDWDTWAEEYASDPDSRMGDVANDRLVCRQPGTYYIVGGARFVVGTGTGPCVLQLKRNGAVFCTKTFFWLNSAVYATADLITAPVELDEGDVVTMTIIQVTGGDRTLESVNRMPFLAMCWSALFSGVAGGAPAPHPLLGATEHSDTVSQTPSRGSLIYGNPSSVWDELLPTALGHIPRFNGTDTLMAFMNELRHTDGVQKVLTDANRSAIKNRLNLDVQAGLTIATGLITPVNSWVGVFPESGSADNLAGVVSPAGTPNGDVLIILNAGMNTITIKHQDTTEAAAGQRFLMPSTLDVVLTRAGDVCIFVRASTNWQQVTPVLTGGKIGEVPWGPLRIPLKKALPAATNNATLDDDWVYKSPWTNEVQRITHWYVRFESNLAASATFELRKNGTVITGSSITVAAAARDAAIDGFTLTTLADGDSLEVWQTAGNAEDIGGSAFVYGDQDLLGDVTY